MKTITSHQINECNSAITITADEPDPKNGNASHDYYLEVCRNAGLPETVPPYSHNDVYSLRFQHGPIKEVGTNGLTHEALLAILIDRVEGFQSGPYACAENAAALTGLVAAREAFGSRTKARVARGVEGTHTV